MTDITSLEGSKIDTIASSYGLNQHIKKPTHILNLLFPCSDLIFTSKPNLVMESGVHSSLHPSCQHQINIRYKVKLLETYKQYYQKY